MSTKHGLGEAMRLLNRDITRYMRRIHEIPHYLWYFLKCFVLFKRPFRFIYFYLTATPPADRLVEMRNGLKIHLSEHPHDIIAVFVVFARQDYGKIDPHSLVVDIGANIGVFSLYAAHSNARRVLAYEPNRESFDCLRRNIQANHLEEVIEPHRLAVSSVAGEEVMFPRTSSPYNAIAMGEGDSDYEVVETIDLSAMLGDTAQVDLLKLDCEGSEYDILLKSDENLLSRIDKIRLEFHLGREGELQAHLRRHGFTLRHFRADTHESGNMWYAKDRE
jgi:FkbM family methyltransferase